MSSTIKINKDLVIDLLPSADGKGPALCLHTCSEPQQSLVIFLSEIYLLRDALATAGSNLASMERQKHKERVGSKPAPIR
jgi:hypothetical protein